MTKKARHPGVHHRDSVDDQHRAGEVSSESSRVTCLPGWFLAVALDYLDAAKLCAYRTATLRRRSASRRGVASG